MKVELSGRTVVVTGAGSGIGQTIAQRFADTGAHVVVADIDADGATATASTISEAGGSAAPAQLDITSEDAVSSLFQNLEEHDEACDILINNAGISRPAPTEQMTRESWDDVLAVNLTGAFLCSKHTMTGMRSRGWGRIVMIASFNSKTAPMYGDNASYAASKAGVVGLTHNLAMELAPHSVTVNAVAPGVVDTALVRAAHSDARRKEIAGRIPLTRYASTDEVAATAVFLASDQAASITGETVNVNGGLYMD